MQRGRESGFVAPAAPVPQCVGTQILLQPKVCGARACRSGPVAQVPRKRDRGQPIARAARLEYCIPAMSTSDRAPRPATIRLASEPEAADASPPPRVAVEPIESPESFKSRAYTALKDVIVSMDVYRSRADIRLDERQLALDFGISRTPVREAMAQLEREGFVRAVPRRGI